MTEKPVAQFVAKALSVLDATDAGRIDIVVTHWSSEEELEPLRKAIVGGDPGAVLTAFQTARPPAAVVLTPGIRGGLGARVRERRKVNVQFACQIETPAGRRVFMATDQRLGLGEDPRRPPQTEPELNLLEIRFGPDGKGVGKLAPASTNVAYNKEKKIFEIKDFAAQPVRLSEVRLEKR